jgi:hypothetical protein
MCGLAKFFNILEFSNLANFIKILNLRQRQGRLQRRLSLANVKKVVSTDKAEKVEKRTAEHRAIAIKKIKE